MTPAHRFLAGLLRRGVRAGLRGARLELSPSSAWRELTPDERIVLSKYRAEIKSLIRSGEHIDTTIKYDDEPEPQPEPRTPTPEERRAADLARLKAQDIDAYGVICPTDPDVVEHRRKRATAEMMASVGRRAPEW